MFGITKKTPSPQATPQVVSPGIVNPLDKRRTASKKIWQKRIPTLAGLTILIVAMVAGVFLFSEGTGVFAPRATPQTTPKNIKITNVTDTGFTVSFLTDESTPGFLKYGTAENELDAQAGDERDQLTGSVLPYTMHHIPVRGLQPNTNYYFTLGTGTQSTFTNNGVPFQVRTAQNSGTQPVAKTVYGSVTNETGVPAEGAVVYVKHPAAGELSSLVKNSGSWAVYLSNARTPNGVGYAETTDDDILLISVQGTALTQKAQITTTVANAQPVETIAYGQTTTQTAPLTEGEETEDTLLVATEEASEEATMKLDEDKIVDEPSDEELEFTPEVLVLDLEEAKNASESVVTVTTTQPVIKGIAKPNVSISIQVHSETQISQELTANADGTFSLDIAALSENLEPGEHTVTYSYTDPDTGELVTETITFQVAQTAVAQATTQPYGSGNPVPMPSPSPSPTPSPTPSPSPSPSPTMEATPAAIATEEARVSLPATDSAIPVSGSVGTTVALVLGGLFFIISGGWSFWISSQLRKGELEF